MAARAAAQTMLGLALSVAMLACGGDAGSSTPTSPDPVSPAPSPNTPTVTPLRQLVQNRGLRMRVGAAAGSLFNSTDAASAQYMTVLSREFNVLTPENEMKFSSLRPSRTEYRYARPDSMVAWAAQNTMLVRGHVLVWHSQLPGWLTSGSWTAAETRTLMLEHIAAVAGHYKGKLAAWDVVNEAYTDGTPTMRPGFWYDRLGRGYIEEAFRAAYAADSLTPLYYNDYNIEGLGAKSDSVYNLLRDLKARGVPVHGVGMQMHLIAGAIPTVESLTSNFARFAALGLKIQITEMDVRMPTPGTTTMYATQAQNYRDVANVCLQQPACDMLVVWGVTDRASWVPSTFSGQGEALLFDRDFVRKPAYTALNDLLSGR